MPRSVSPKLPARCSAVLLVLIILMSGLISGCSSSSSSSDAPAVGNNVHGAGWRFEHDDAAKQDPIGCQVCHGVDFSGSGEAVSCYSCHIGGPPFVIHPPSFAPSFPWKHPINHGSEAKKDIQACQGCHGQPGGPGSNPRFNLPIRSLEAGCESAVGCHDNFNDPFASFDNGHNPGAAHPAFDPNDPSKQDLLHWYGERFEYLDDSGMIQTYLVSHYNAGNLVGACSLCHGANLQGGVGPACTACHVVDPIASPAKCLSCHGEPPVAVDDYLAEVARTEPLDPVFRAEVQAGKHLQHDAIACSERENEQDCRVCHVNTETGLSGQDPRTNVNKHHLLTSPPATIPIGSDAPCVPVNDPGGLFNDCTEGTSVYDCFSCHYLALDPDTFQFETVVERDCQLCHPQIFPALPCPE